MGFSRLLRKDENGVGSLIGEILTVAVAVSVIGVFGGALIGSVDGPDDPVGSQFRAVLTCGSNGWGTGDEQVLVYHAGGPILDANSTTLEIQAGYATERGAVSDRLVPHQRLAQDTIAALTAEHAGSVDPFATGDLWAGSPRTLQRDAAIHVQVKTQTGPDSQLRINAVVTERICDRSSSTGGILSTLFGTLPFEDIDCDGIADPTDELLDPQDFADGIHAMSRPGCLVLPAGSGQYVAPDVVLMAPKGITISTPITATLGSIQLESAGPITVASGVRLESANDILISGMNLTLQGAILEAKAGKVHISSPGGFIFAEGLDIQTGTALPPPMVPEVDLPNQAGPGSIRMCMAILDADNHVTNGWQFHDRTLTLRGRMGTAEFNEEGILPNVEVSTPIVQNADLFFEDGISDSYCIVYNDLAIGNWFYDTSLIDDGTQWREPIYNDQNQVAIQVLDDFFPYSGELFDNDPGNDANRDSNSDGHILLTDSRPYRTVVTLFRSLESRVPEVNLQSGGGEIFIENASFVARDSDILVQSQGGWIRAENFLAHSFGHVGQVRMESEGGFIWASSSDLLSQSGLIVLSSQNSMLDLRGSVVTAHQDIELTSGSHLDLRNADIRSTAGDLTAATDGLLVQIRIHSATLLDRDNQGTASTIFGGIQIMGSPASGDLVII